MEASNGASDYGNKFGEPVICGFARSFGLTDSSGERREWIKPIMFSGGVGSIDHNMTEKLKPEKGNTIIFFNASLMQTKLITLTYVCRLSSFYFANLISTKFIILYFL